MKKFYTLLLFFSSAIFLALGVLRSNGYVGTTEKDGGTGCNCHSLSPFSQVSAWVQGPDSVLVGATANYKLYMTGGPKIRGGFNIATLKGKLSPVDGLTKLMHYVAGDTQLTHSLPLNFNNKDTIFWSFSYKAPSIIGFDTIYSTVNSTNGNGMSDGNDRWNFGQKFAVKIHNTPVKVENESIVISDFKLEQNYPNPFSARGGSVFGGNASTKISWQSPVSSWQTIKLFDVLGKELETIVDGFYEAGKHSKLFVINSSMPSGVYFYQLLVKDQITGDVVYFETKKMLLMK